MKLYNVHLTENQVKELQALAQRTGLLAAEIIRRALDEYLEQQRIHQIKKAKDQL